MIKSDINNLVVKTSGSGSEYLIRIGSGLLRDAGKFVQSVVGENASKVCIVSNPTVYELYGAAVAKSLSAAKFKVSTHLIGDGERYKTPKTTEKTLAGFSEAKLGRTDIVIALGGGVVGDVAGFAAAVYLRGIRFIQIPTTLLSMVDSSVGGKTGVNSSFGKNLIGAFHQPAEVLIDVDVLKTLPRRELTAGFCEVVKHGALAGKTLLGLTGDLLDKYSIDSFDKHFEGDNFRSEISDLIAANIEFKSKIVAGDERESAARTDARSRKILNFGHTLAHALERVTNYRRLKHGEAVGYGIKFAIELSKNLDLMDESSVKSLNGVLHRVGSLPSLSGVDSKAILAAFDQDKKNVDGTLQLVLLKGLGEPIIVGRNEIPSAMIRSALRTVLR